MPDDVRLPGAALLRPDRPWRHQRECVVCGYPVDLNTPDGARSPAQMLVHGVCVRRWLDIIDASQGE